MKRVHKFIAKNHRWAIAILAIGIGWSLLVASGLQKQKDQASMQQVYKTQTASAATLPSSNGDGINYELYKILKLPNGRRTRSIPSMPGSETELIKKGQSPKIDLSQSTLQDHIAMRFEGYIVMPQNGEYTFLLYSDAWSKMRIDGELVVNNDGVHNARRRSSSKIQLQQGVHSIKVEYFELKDNQMLKAYRKGPQFFREEIPTTALYTTNPTSNTCNLTVNAGADQSVELPGQTLTLAGNGDCISNYVRSQVSGPNQAIITSPASANTTVTDLNPWTYEFKLTVTDSQGNSKSDTVLVDVIMVIVDPVPPEVNAGDDQQVTLPTNTTTVQGTIINGDIHTTQRTQLKGPNQATINTPNQINTTISNLIDWIYVFRLTARGSFGSEAYDDIQIAVIGFADTANIPPTVDAGPDQITLMPDNAVLLQATASDQDGTVVKTVRTKVSWSDNYTITNTTATQTSITSLEPGTYIFRLTATDNKWAEGYDDVAVTVNMVFIDPLPPTVNAWDDQSITLPNSTTTLQGSASDNTNSPVAVTRTKMSGPATYNITNPNSAQTTVTNLTTAGTYIFRLTATSNLTPSPIYDDVQITVNPETITPPPTNTFTPTYYVSPTGAGNGASSNSPMNLKQALSIVKAGESIWLMDGIYKGADNMITPPSGKSWTATKPITIKAMNDGKAIIDGEWINNAVSLAGGNNHFILEGFDAKNGNGVSIVLVKDSTGNTIKRVVATNQYQNQMENAFRTWNATDTVFEDISVIWYFRKAVSTSQNSDRITIRRAFVDRKWSSLMGPKHTFALAYNNDNTICENCIATIDNLMPTTYELLNSNKTPSGQRFQNSEIQQPNDWFGHDGQDGGYVVKNVKILWSLFFQPGNQKFWQTSYKYWAAPFTVEIPNFTLKDNISFIEPGFHTKMRNVALSSNGVVTNLTQIGWELGHIGGSRTQTNNYSASNCNAVQGGYSIVNPNPTVTQWKGAVIMKRYKNGVLTNEDLWPRPMDARIQAAAARDWYNSYSLTDKVFSLCGWTKPNFGWSHGAPTNSNPTVNAWGDQAIKLPLASALLTAIASDSDGNIVSTQWTQISGPTSASITSPTSVMTMIGWLNTVGNYIFRVTVTDNNGATASDEVQITVQAAANNTNTSPTVNAWPDQTITLPTSSVSINANASDPDGMITSISRSKLSWPNTYTLVNPNTTNVSITNLTTAGTYLFRVTVTDNNGATAHDDVQVTVNDNTPPPPSGDLNQIIATAKQRLSASPSQRTTLEPQLKARTDTNTIDQIVEAARPKGTDTKVGKVYNQKFTLPKYATKYADQWFHVSVPSNYKPDKPTGVIFRMEWGGSPTNGADWLVMEMRHNEDFDMNYEENGNTKSYVFPSAKEKYIVISGIAPRGELMQAYGMPPLHANRRAWKPTQPYLRAMYEEVSQHYNLDPNDVHLAGFSMGWNGAYYAWVKFGDRFGKIMASAWSIHIFEPKLFKNNLFTIIHGTLDAYFNSTSDCRKHFTPIEGARLAYNLLKAVNPLTVMAEYPGHHGRWDDPIAENAWTAFVNNPFKRNPYTSDVFAMNPRLAYIQGSNYNVTWTDTDPTPDTLWVSINEVGNGTIPYTQAVTQGDGGCSSATAFNNWSITQSTTSFKWWQAQVNNLGNNHISITSQNVKSMSLRLHPAKMWINTTQPVTVTVNGNSNQYTCNPSLFTALSYIDKRQDRGLVYQCQIDINNIP